MFVSGRPPVAGTKTGMSSPPCSRMKCGTKITPCGGAAWGRLGKNAFEKRNCPAGTARGGRSDSSGSCAFQARSMCGAFPMRALRVAHGVTLVSPRRGAGKSLKLKGRFLREGFSEEADRSSFGKNSRNSCNSWIQKICGSLRDLREKSLCWRISRASGDAYPPFRSSVFLFLCV